MVSHRSSRRSALRGQSRHALAVLTAAAGAAAALAPSVPAGAQPADDAGHPSRAAVSSRVDRLYEQAEVATQKYDAAAERTERLREQAGHAQDSAARVQDKVNRLRAALGSLAGAQYRSGGLDPSVALMLSSDPAGYLDRAAALDRIGSRQKDKLDSLRAALRTLDQQRAEAGRKLSRLEHEQRELKRQKKSVQKKLRSARRLLAQLTPDERERAARERASRGAERGQSPLGLSLGGERASSPRAAAAVAAVRSAVGRPYAWGAAGPRAFDCSGLTQWAYAQAGVAIPRTSQGQRWAGRQVAPSQARPGDLVVYRDDAGHVAMYVGHGQVVHAPYPGARVRYDPVGMMPISSVTRP